jgi:hypothetical protein
MIIIHDLSIDLSFEKDYSNENAYQSDDVSK